MPGGKLLDISNILGGLLPFVREYMGQTYGMCNSCSEPAIPLPCSKCGEPTCARCAWIKGEVVTHRTMPRVVCSMCVEAIEVEGGPEWQKPPGVANVAKERRMWALGIMGLEEGFTQAELKKRHRALSKKYHPDKNPGDGAAEAAFKQVQSAYEALKEDGNG